MKTASEESSYGFVNGRVRALETTLLDRQRYERLVRTGSTEEFKALLADSIYGRYMAEEKGDDLEQAFALAAAEAHGLVKRYSTDRWLLRMFRSRVDFHNLKTMLKDRIAGRETGPDKLQDGGDWSGDQLEALAAGVGDAEPAGVREAVADAVKVAAGKPGLEPAILETLLDRVEQENQLILAASSRFVSGYLAVHADVENLQLLVRTKVLAEERDVFEDAFLPGGALGREQLVDFWSEELDAMPGRLRMTRYGRLAEEGIAGVRQGTMLRLERIGREYRLYYLLESRYLTFGHGPLFAYCLFRENEITNLRQLHAGKEAGLQETQCREMVAYVG